MRKKGTILNTRTIISLVVAFILLVGGISLAIVGSNTPETKEEEVTRLNYKVKGGFDYQQAYGKSTKWKDEPNPVFFPEIIDTILVSYDYRFLTDEPVNRVNGYAEISGVLKSGKMWEKEVTLVPRRKTVGDFSTSFLLNTADFLVLTDNISEELGVSTYSPQLILKATVYTEAETQAGVLKDDFIQTCQLDLSKNTIEWHRPFTLSRKGYWEGLIYEHQGDFSYAVKLKPNILFGEIVMHPDTLEVSPLVKLAPSSSYPADITETIDVTLSYQLDSDQPVTQVRNEVEVNAVLSKPEGEEILFKPVPKSQLEENSTITFPLNVALFYDIIEAAEKETEGATPDYELMIRADVHTVARSDFGIIDEAISPSLKLKLEPSRLLWPEETEETEAGSITGNIKSGAFKETVVVPNPGRKTTIIVSWVIFGMMAVALLYTICSYILARKKVTVPEVDAEAIRAKRKHQDIIVDVQSLPPRVGQAVINIDSLDELIKVADTLTKPVLHKAEVGKHTYYVNDGLTLYEYVSLEYPETEEKEQ